MTRHPTRADAEADLRSMLGALDPSGTVTFEAMERRAILYDPATDERMPWWVDEIFEIDHLLCWMRER
ncbi:hypothetical protein [Agrococcus terreus]|uniref:Uncharacterized protein n=1 Tax=Agrococcus terreus TaxID=574649 RepID=A0ABQ2KGI0_9MICO|nr:hypothetical protein [Agrococcus terreus]GGN81116.1 hypothetical protein GCM10010968_09680 [Agrococcus terreus]